MILVHGTAIDIGGQGVLLRGPSGAGKSDLALRLIEAGARLVSDDQTRLSRDGEGPVMMTAPETIAGLIEVRGLGLLRMVVCDASPLRLLIDLVPPDQVERMPPPETESILGHPIPRLRLHPWEASAQTKVRLAVGVATGGIMALR